MRRTAPASVLAVLSLTAVAAARPLVVGWNSPPRSTDPALAQQNISFSAAVITEAARRAGIRLEWREIRNGAEVNRALDERRIDLSPAAVATSVRRARYHLTRPWWSDDLMLVVRADGPQRESALAGKRIAIKLETLAEAARQAFPHSLILPVGPDANPGRATLAVCRGEADAALMTHRDAEMMLGLARPPDCTSVRLSLLPVAATLDISLMSHREKAAAAERLRVEIDRMTVDGTLARIAAHSPGVQASSAIALAERMRDASQKQTLWLIIAFLIAIGIVVSAALWRLWVMHKRLRVDMQARLAAEDALRRSNEDLQAYAYTISHDLQEPLRMVSIYVELLGRRHGDRLDGQAAEYMDTIRTGAQRMSTMLYDLLQFSRAAHVSEPPSDVDVGRCVRAALDTLATRIAETGASVTVGPLPVVHAWENRLEQVFQNLIENALKYRRPGVRPSIEIGAERADAMWRFSVTDNGIGMRMDYAERIFRVFQRLHGRADYGGNGIGLAIAKRIVERHRGRIWVDWSIPGEGTRFCFTVPVSRPAVLLAQHEPAAVTSEHPSPNGRVGGVVDKSSGVSVPSGR